MRNVQRRTPLVVVSLLLMTSLLLAACASPTHQTARPVNPRQGCPAWVNPPAPAQIPPPTDQSPYAIALHTAQIVARTPRPILNPYTTLLSPLRHLAQPVACLVRNSPRSARLGQEDAFWTQNEDTGDQTLIHARLAYITPHLYMYVQDGAPIVESALEDAANFFEQQTLVKDESTFGTHWSPGVDHDPHITVLHALNLGKDIGGYFSIADEYPRAISPYSNERQMIYINLSGGVTPGTAYYDATLAHEFQHMIHWYYRPADESWTNEGMSVLAQHLNGLTTDRIEDVFQLHPGIQLTSWGGDLDTVLSHYGAGYLFNDYFADHYGGYSVLRQLLSDPAQTPLNYDDVLAASGSQDRFDDVFAKWVVANLINDPRAGEYVYPDLPGLASPAQTRVASYPFASGTPNHPATVAQYGTTYYSFPAPPAGSSLHITFKGQPLVPIVPNQPYAGATNEWWSNAGTEMDATLTHAFDLRGVTGNPAFHFAAWYDLPGNGVYLVISSDGGKTWTTPTVNVESGGNFCCAFTLKSGGGTTSSWELDNVDLTPYVGKQILVRFEYVERDNGLAPGMTLDHFSIPEIGFADDVSSDGGWQAAGFVRTPNLLPEHYMLTAVVFRTSGAAPEVLRIPVDPATAVGTLALPAIPDLAGARSVTVAVSAAAPTIKGFAPYQLSVDAG